MIENEVRPSYSAARLPGPYSLVLENRPLRQDIDLSALSKFSENRWSLSEAIFERHYQNASLNFLLVPQAFRYVVKVYIWHELNYEGNDLPSLRRSSVAGRLAVFSTISQLRNLRALLDWLVVSGINSLADVTTEVLDKYLEAVIDSERSHGERSDLLQAVRRLWSFRDLLPPEGRLPEMPPWGGKGTKTLLGSPTSDRENRTKRINEVTMTMLLLWALRFVEDFAPDILRATDEYRPLHGLNPGRNGKGSKRRARSGVVGASAEVEALIEDFRRDGRALPGKKAADGSLELNWHFIAKLLDLSPVSVRTRYATALLDSGLSIADHAYLGTLPTARLDGRPWVDGFTDRNTPMFARLLSTACFIVITYLTGMRPGEVLSLKRGCVAQDPRSKIWLVTSTKWKGAVAQDGTKIPEGQVRDAPWVTVEVVEHATRVLERLHGAPILFPSPIPLGNGGSKPARAMSYPMVARELARFVDWVNEYCTANGRDDKIPADSHALTASRFRRTLAWFICRRPRGLVAAAIQYGHLHVQITQGYGGTYESGFPDEVAYEKWLTHLDNLFEADRRMKDGGHVSGPAANSYRARVVGGIKRFAGTVVRTGKEARHVLVNPELQIYPGRGMTCVFSSALAQCELVPSPDDAKYTPNTDDCRTNCQCIAHTDENINEVFIEIENLRVIVDDDASPPIRLERERRRLDRLQKIVDNHESSRPSCGSSDSSG